MLFSLLVAKSKFKLKWLHWVICVTHQCLTDSLKRSESHRNNHDEKNVSQIVGFCVRVDLRTQEQDTWRQGRLKELHCKLCNDGVWYVMMEQTSRIYTLRLETVVDVEELLWLLANRIECKWSEAQETKSRTTWSTRDKCLTCPGATIPQKQVQQYDHEWLDNQSGQ